MSDREEIKNKIDIERKENYKLNIIIISVISLAVMSWAWNFSFGFKNLFIENRQGIGEFGDIFGIINSAFSGMAFIGIVYSILLQRMELKTVREERDETRNIFRDQKENLSQQRFETTFFQLFDFFNRVADSVEIETSESGKAKVVNGRAAFEFYCKYILDLYSELKRKEVEEFGDIQVKFNNDFSKASSAESKAKLSQMLFEANIKFEGHEKRIFERVYDHFFYKNGDDIGKYMRSLYTILNFIEVSFDSSEFKDNMKKELIDEKRRFYFKLIRAQLSQHEATFLVINYICVNTTEEFNSLLRKYGMAKNSDTSSVLFKDFGREIDKSLFGRTKIS